MTTLTDIRSRVRPEWGDDPMPDVKQWWKESGTPDRFSYEDGFIDGWNEAQKDTVFVLDALDSLEQWHRQVVTESNDRKADTDRLAAALRCTEPPMSPDAFQAKADAAAIIAADPTLICPDPADHELAAAVRHAATESGWRGNLRLHIYRGTYIPQEFEWYCRVGDPFDKWLPAFGGDTLEAAITAALEDKP